MNSQIYQHPVGAITVACSGRFDPAEFATLLTSRQSTKKRGVLFDMEDVDFSIPSSAIRGVAWKISRSGHLLPAKVAFVASDGLAFGMLRMFVLFLGAASDAFEVFMDHLSAIAWITKEPSFQAHPGEKSAALPWHARARMTLSV